MDNNVDGIWHFATSVLTITYHSLTVFTMTCLNTTRQMNHFFVERLIVVGGKHVEVLVKINVKNGLLCSSMCKCRIHFLRQIYTQTRPEVSTSLRNNGSSIALWLESINILYTLCFYYFFFGVFPASFHQLLPGTEFPAPITMLFFTLTVSQTLTSFFQSCQCYFVLVFICKWWQLNQLQEQLN